MAFKARKAFAGRTTLLRQYHYDTSASRTQRFKVVAEGAIKEGELVILHHLIGLRSYVNNTFYQLLTVVLRPLDIIQTSDAGHVFGGHRDHVTHGV